MKFYGLPPERPIDRHKWFFSSEEAERYVRHRAAANGMRVLQIDRETPRTARAWRTSLKTLALRLLFRSDLNPINFNALTLWAVLAKENEA